MPRKPRDMTKAELLREVERLRVKEEAWQHREAAAEHVAVYREELESQAESLLKAQRDLETSRDEYADLYDFAPMGYATLDANGVVEEINLTGSAMLGVARERLIRRPLLCFVEKEDQRAFLNLMFQCRHSDKPVSGELRLRSRQGQTVSVHFTGRPATRPRIGGICYRVALADLSQLKLAEQEKEELILREKSAAAAAEAKDQFLAVLSHELRTPLTPIMAAVTSLREGSVPAEMKGMLEMIRRNVQLEAQLIDDLLDVTRIIHSKLRLRMEAIDVHSLVHDVFDICGGEIREKGLRTAIHLGADRHYVKGDPVRLRQVLWNLVKNAIKFTPGGGTIAISTRNQSPMGSENGQGRGLIIEVSDTGIGIEPEVISQLFQPFKQVEDTAGRGHGGLGLGLAISKGLIEAHGGQISASSKGRQQGTTFRIELQTVSAPRAAQPAGVRRARPQRRQGLRILLVEDHADTARIMARLLRSEGHEVEVADSVQSALRRNNGAIDLVISDIGLPDGSGLDLMRQMRQARPVRGIAMSGFGADQDVRSSKEAGFDEHLTKPVDFGRLVEAIERIAEPEEARELRA